MPPVAKKIGLYFTDAEDRKDIFEISLIDAPEAYVEKAIKKYEEQNFILVDRIDESIKLSRKYDRWYWASVGAVSGSVIGTSISWILLKFLTGAW